MSSTAKIEFANTWRGIAALIVLFAHYVLVFHSINGAYINFPPLSEPPFTLAFEIYLTPPLYHINYGALGVGFFFLISGLAIPLSVASLSAKRGGFFAFIVGRVLRIWPTYAVGALISVGAGAIGLIVKLTTPLFISP